MWDMVILKFKAVFAGVMIAAVSMFDFAQDAMADPWQARPGFSPGSLENIVLVACRPVHAGMRMGGGELARRQLDLIDWDEFDQLDLHFVTLSAGHLATYMHGKHNTSFGLPAADTPLRTGFLTKHAIPNPFESFDCPVLGESISLWQAQEGRIQTWAAAISMSELTSSAD